MKPHPYTLKFTKRLENYDYSVQSELGFPTIKIARQWVKSVSSKAITKTGYKITSFNIVKTRVA
jgi:hypothetical protein